eukprot:6272353-Amphidinium_carterae.1
MGGCMWVPEPMMNHPARTERTKSKRALNKSVLPPHRPQQLLPGQRLHSNGTCVCWHRIARQPLGVQGLRQHHTPARQNVKLDRVGLNFIHQNASDMPKILCVLLRRILRCDLHTPMVAKLDICKNIDMEM